MFGFYSKRLGWKDGTPVRFYQSSYIDDPYSVTQKYVDMTGEKIYKLIGDTEDKTLKQLKEQARIYYDWYYYPANTIITTMCSL